MSRIIVKGLPKYYNEEKLRQHFATKGDITDVKLRTNRQGESRRFAFIGFKNEDDAEVAVKYFNGSFIDTAKIEVSLAKSFVDPTVPKSFKEKKREAYERVRQREEREREREEREKERESKRQRTDKKSRIDEEIENDPKLKEFIEATKSSNQAKSWSNDVVVNEGGAPVNSLLEKALALKDGESNLPNSNDSNNQFNDLFKIQENESDDEYNDLESGNNNNNNNNNVEEDEDEQMMGFDDFKPSSTSENKEEDGDKPADEDISDLEWLKRRRIRIKDNGEIIDNTESTKEGEEEGTSSESTRSNEGKQFKNSEPIEPKQSEEEINISKIQETGRLFLRNILYSATEDDFKKLFQPFGNLEEVHIAIDTRTSKSKGFCYIQFTNSEDAVKAYIELDKQIFQGRLLHILPAQGKKSHELDEFDLKNLPLKKQKELKKKRDASKSQFSWNSLFLNQDAVMDTIASDLGVEKSSLIDPENSNSAVKQALAEAHVIGDIRKFFEDKGIDLTKFENKEKDDSVILVKNIPHGTTEGEIIELFQPFGELKRILVPPSGTIAIVQFKDLPTGRSAFTKLSYRRFKKSILYLEKGPIDLFTREPSNEETINKSTIEVKEDVKEIAESHKDHIEEEVEVFEGATVSIFVKNLNFATTNEELTSLFSKLPGFVIATVKTKPDPKDSSKRLSMGFGFAEFKSKGEADAAISTLDNSVLNGHKLQLKLSHRQNVVGSTKTKNNKAISSKIIVKNLPFEATRKDVFELFNSFGQLKSVRVPKKFDKSARGFAFVEFVIPKEAESAMDQLKGVHLLGRRLVMQYAEQASNDAEEEIEKMTKKVKKQVATQQLGALRLNGKRKLDLDDDEVDSIDNI